MPELVKSKSEVCWWRDDESMENESVEVEIGFEDGSIYIDGLREGEYLSLPLKDVARAIAGVG